MRGVSAYQAIHIMAIDGIINVNSLFTVAVFLGLAFYPTIDSKTTLLDKDEMVCLAGVTIAESLITNHVYSFSSFLFSSLIALALKLSLKADAPTGRMHNGKSVAHVNLVVFRLGMVVSSAGSVFGCGFLMMALVDLVQIKLGVLSCLSFYSLAAVIPLLVLVPSALVIYVCVAIYAITL